MALADILKNLGLGLGQAAGQGLQTVGDELQARSSPLAFQAAQQRKVAEAQSQQQDFQNQLQMMLGIHSGALQQVPEGTPGALSGQFQGGVNVLPTQPKTFNIQRKSELGHWLDLDQDMNGIPMEDYLKLSDKAAELRSKYNQQQSTRQAIDQAKINLDGYIDEMYNPDRYMKLYGEVDPDLATQRQLRHSQANEAAAADRKLATGTTEINRLYETIAKPTPWEARKLHGQQTQETQDIEGARAKATYLAEHPLPDDKEVKDWADRIEQEGADSGTIGILKGIHPQMLGLVDKELAKRGTTMSAITTEMKNNHAKANVALQTMKEMQPYLSMPGMKDTFGVMGSRWQDFMSGVGDVPSQEWKHIQDKTHFISALLRNIHFGVRGGANIEIKKEFDKIANAGKMDFDTFRTGMQDFQDLLEQYSREGLTPSANPTSATSTAPATKQRKYINVGGVIQPNPNYRPGE